MGAFGNAGAAYRDSVVRRDLNFTDGWDSHWVCYCEPIPETPRQARNRIRRLLVKRGHRSRRRRRPNASGFCNVQSAAGLVNPLA